MKMEHLEQAMSRLQATLQGSPTSLASHARSGGSSVAAHPGSGDQDLAGLGAVHLRDDSANAAAMDE